MPHGACGGHSGTHIGCGTAPAMMMDIGWMRAGMTSSGTTTPASMTATTRIEPDEECLRQPGTP